MSRDGVSNGGEIEVDAGSAAAVGAAGGRGSGVGLRPGGLTGLGSIFAEIEADAREVGHEFMRLVMELTNSQQAVEVPEAALQTDTGEVATGLITQVWTLVTEAGNVSWKEPNAYLPKSRKAFFPSVAKYQRLSEKHESLHAASAVGFVFTASL